MGGWGAQQGLLVQIFSLSCVFRDKALSFFWVQGGHFLNEGLIIYFRKRLENYSRLYDLLQEDEWEEGENYPPDFAVFSNTKMPYFVVVSPKPYQLHFQILRIVPGTQHPMPGFLVSLLPAKMLSFRSVILKVFST